MRKLAALRKAEEEKLIFYERRGRRRNSLELLNQISRLLREIYMR